MASVPGDWDRQKSYDAATNIMQQNPDIVGFYCNNDGMALGVVEAVKAAGMLDKIAVIGTDGISDAYASIKAGELTATVDSFPVLTGEVALEVACACRPARSCHAWWQHLKHWSPRTTSPVTPAMKLRYVQI